VPVQDLRGLFHRRMTAIAQRNVARTFPEPELASGRRRFAWRYKPVEPGRAPVAAVDLGERL
jgi:hypothetical protein